jgi:hypothetical protein
MANSNYILNQRISNLQYQLDHLPPDTIPNLDSVLFEGNTTNYQSIINNDSTFILNTSSNNSSLTLTDNTNISVLSATDLTFNGTSIINLPTVKTLINIVSTSNFNVITPNVYYTSALKNGVVYMTPNKAQISITFLTSLSLYNILVLSSPPTDSDYYFIQWTNLNNDFISQQVYLSTSSLPNLFLKVPQGLTVGNYTLNLPSFSYIVS